MSICSLGLSCDPICDHGIHTSRQRCIYCELQKQITALTDMYKSLSIQVAAHHEHKLRQIDENRKISRRVDETDHIANCQGESISIIIKNLNKLERELESNHLTQELNPQVWKFVTERIDKLEKLESKFADFMQKSILNCEKRPFKCPVCNGEIKILIDPSTPMSGIQAMFGKRDSNGMYYKDCVSCDKGIIWG